MRYLAFLCALMSASSVAAQDLAPLDPAQLQAQTGGLRTPFGVDIGFGATVSTYVDGRLALQTQLTWTDQGAVQSTVGGMSNADLAQRASAGGIHLEGAKNGLFIAGDNGGTAVIHDLTDGRVSGLVFNTADNRNIRQDTAITLDIPDLAQVQKDIAMQQVTARLSDSVNRALGAGR